MSHYGRGDNYGRGDYYGAGDYYRGDSVFSRLFRGVKGVIGGFAAGGLTGAIAGGIGGLVGSGSHPSLPRPKSNLPAIAPPAFLTAGGGELGGGGLDIGGVSGGGGGMIPGLSGAGPFQPTKGYHANKSTYETRGGGTSRWGGPALQLHRKGTVLVRNRRMNVGNARALKRSLRRAAGFARLARRVMSFTHPRAGRGHFKLKRRGKR